LHVECASTAAKSGDIARKRAIDSVLAAAVMTAAVQRHYSVAMLALIAVDPQLPLKLTDVSVIDDPSLH